MIPYKEITIEKAKPKFINSSPIITLEAIEMNQNTTFQFPGGQKGD